MISTTCSSSSVFRDVVTNSKKYQKNEIKKK